MCFALHGRDSTGTGTGTVPGRNNVALVWPRNIFVPAPDHVNHFCKIFSI